MFPIPKVVQWSTGIGKNYFVIKSIENYLEINLFLKILVANNLFYININANSSRDPKIYFSVSLVAISCLFYSVQHFVINVSNLSSSK